MSTQLHSTQSRPVAVLSLNYLAFQVFGTIVIAIGLYSFSNIILNNGYQNLGGIGKLSWLFPATFFILPNTTAEMDVLKSFIISSITFLSILNICLGSYYVFGWKKITSFYVELFNRVPNTAKGKSVLKNIFGFWVICAGFSLAQFLGLLAFAVVSPEHGKVLLSLFGLLANAIGVSALVPSIVHLCAFRSARRSA